MRCSVDFRQRVVDFVRSGGSKAEAARRFKVGERWLKPGGVAYKRPGPHRSPKLDWEHLRRQVEEQNDLTQTERARSCQVSRHGIWYALQQLAVTREKRDGLPRMRPSAAQTVPAPS